MVLATRVFISIFKNTEEYGRRSVVGCRAGANVTNKDLAMKKYSAANIEEELKGEMWMTGCEMTFLRAEGCDVRLGYGRNSRCAL